jgi:UPF0755 protein
MMTKRKVFLIGIFSLIGIALMVAVAYAHLFGPVDPYAQQTQFIVSEDETTYQVVTALRAQGFIRSRTAFQIAYDSDNKDHLTTIRPGGYEISANMDVWSIAHALQQPPYLVFFTFPPGWRKEQIADKLTSVLGWTASQKQEWLNLIPSDQTPAQIAERFRDRFQQEFAPYASKAAQEGLPWTEVVILASLLQREAAGPADMPLISGIMLNRLKKHMALQIDATLQYVVGNEANWWPVPTSSDKFVDSPFNTYEHAGLPPHPIDEPSLTAINAVLNAKATSCLFYLHDTDGNIHCSDTYAGQIANVQKYLK